MSDSASQYAHAQMATWAAEKAVTLNWWVGLFADTADPSLSGSEFTLSGYARAAVTLTRAGAILTNTAEITWPGMTVGAGSSQPWGGTALFDAVSGGNLWYWQDYFPRLSVTDSVPPKIAAGALQIVLQ